MKFLSDLLVQGDGNEIFLKSADHNISRIIPRGTGANLDKGLFSLFDTGTEDVRIDTAGNSWFNGGNVGIGTAAPGASLHVASTTNDFVAKFSHSTATGYAPGSILLEASQATSRGQGIYHYNTNADKAWFTGVPYNVSSNKWIVANKPDTTFNPDVAQLSHALLTIEDNGRVGIGTTSPDTLLHIESTISTSSPIFTIQNDNDIKLKLGAVRSGAGTAPDSTFIAYDGDLRFIADADSTTEVVRIDSSGNVGIGTTSPSKKLHVNGSYKLGTNAYIQYDAAYPYTINIQNTASAGDIKLQSANGENKILLQPSTGGIDFYTNSSERMRITDGGNVGIGTTAPGAKLNVVGHSKFNGTNHHSHFNYSGDSSEDTYIRGGKPGAKVYINDSHNSNVLIASGGGNVGIGTTSPGFKLQVGTPAVVSGSSYSWSFDLTRANSTSRGFSIGQADGGGVVVMGGHNTDMAFGHTFGTDTNGNPLFYETMRIQHVDQAVGNVGIGTTSPREKLDVDGDIVTTWGNDKFVGLQYQQGAAYQNGLLLHGDNRSTGLIAKGGTGSTPYIWFGVSEGGNTERMRITKDGNVGIGTTNPSEKLEVAGNIKIGDSNVMYLGAGNDLKIFHNATDSFIINEVGDLKITNGANDKDIIFQSDDGSGGVTTYFTIDGGNEANLFSKNVKLLDDVKLRVGTSNDLEIYHDGSNSYIDDTGTGNLLITSNGASVQINKGLTENMAEFIVDGAVNLYYDSAKKFETTSTGATVSGALAVSGKITNLTAGTGNLDAVNVQQLNNATTGTLIYKGTWSAAPTTTSVLDGAVSSAGTIVIDAVNPGISVGATITGTGISGTVTVSNIAADGITIAISSAQTIADGTTLTFTTVGGTPDLSQASRKVTGHYYICETAGAVTPNGAGTTPNEWAVGDWATFSDLTTDAWQKIDNSSVLSGAGTGGKVPVWSGTGTSVTLADAPITVSGNNATFAGIIGVNGSTTANVPITVTTSSGYEDVAYFKSAGTNINSRISLFPTGTGSGAINSASNNLFLQTSGTTALTIDSSQNATFAGDVTIGGKTYPKISLTDNQGVARTFSVGTNNETFTVRNETASSDAFTISNANNATFAGGVTVTGTSSTFNTGNSGTFVTNDGDGYPRLTMSSSSAQLGLFRSSTAVGGMYIGADTNGFRIMDASFGTKFSLSQSGDATFAGNITFGDSHTIGDDSDDNLVIASSASENIIIDSADDIILDAAGNDVLFKDAGTHIGTINMSSSNLTIESSVSDKDIIFKGNDGGSTITALTLDMSNGGSATFVDDIDLGGKITQTGTGNNTFGGNVTLSSTAPILYLANTTSSTGKTWYFSTAANGNAYISQNGVIDAITLSHTSGNATFAGAVSTGGYLTLNSSDDIPRLIFNGSGDDFFFSNTANYFGLYNDTDSRWDIKVDGAGNTTFAGDVNMASAKIESDGSAAAGAYLELHHNNNDTTDVCATINLTNNAGGYASIIGGTTGANNTGYIEFKTDNAGTQGTVLTLNGDNSATFAGDITATANYSAGNSKIIYKAQRSGGAVAGDWSYDDATTDMSLGTSTAHSFSLKTGNTRALTLDTSQNATFAGDVTVGALTSGATAQLVINHEGGSGAVAKFMSRTNRAFIQVGDNDTNGYIVAEGDLLSIGRAASASSNNININASNNVGIGTTAPKSKLQVAGGIQMADDTAAASADKVGTMRYRTGTEYVEVNGTELVTNGDFAADSNWTKGANTTISGGTLNSTSAGVYIIASQTNVATQNKYYKWEATYTITSGGVRLGFSSGVFTGSSQTSSGTYTGVFQAPSGINGQIYITSPSSDFVGSIDNISVIEVTAEDASYADMCMQTGSSTYEWVNIVRNTY